MTRIHDETFRIVCDLVPENDKSKQLHLLKQLIVLHTGEHEDSTNQGKGSILSALHANNGAKDSETVFSFLDYLFRKRFEWMEQNVTKESDKEMQSFVSSQQSELCCLLDKIIQCISIEEVTVKSLQTYQDIYNKVSNLPVVRSQLAGHIMVWISNSGTKVNSQNIFQHVQGILVSTITDVWSAIRKASCSRLPCILQSLEATNLKLLFDHLVQLCVEPSSLWQVVDGAILGMTVMLNQYILNLKFQPVPDFIKNQLITTVFKLISHPQLTIRETSVRALSIYISGSGEEETLLIFQQVISLLNNRQTCDEEVSVNSLVEAFTAEGLLKICSSIIKVLPLKYHLPKWPSYLTVFLSYLSHEASTVRQTTSLVFKQILFQSDSNPVLFKLMMAKLTSGWKPNCCPAYKDSKLDCTMKLWEGKEGRMFVFELVCEYLVKNHWLNTFGPLQPTKHGEIRRLSNSALSTSSLHTYVQKTASSSPIWSEMMSELGGKSLLQQTYLYDQFTFQNIESLTDFPWLFMEQCRIQYYNQEPVNSTDLTWLKKTDLLACNKLLQTMLYQTMECLVDNQWELRRIAQQVLPLLSEVIRWYDVSLYINIIDETLSQDSDVFTYLGTFLLKEYLEHCVRLMPLLKESPKSWKDPEQCVESIEILVTKLEKQTDKYLSLAEAILTRSSYDKLAIMAAEIIIIFHNHFEVTDKQKETGSSAIFRFWQTLFQFAHPTSQMCHNILLQKSTPEFISHYTGYLSCSLVEAESAVLCARQVEKCLVLTVSEHLMKYLSHVIHPYYLPIVGHYVGQFADNTTICKELIQSLMKLSVLIVEPVLKKNITAEKKPSYLKCLYYTLKELAAVISIKTFDVVLLQRILSIYLILCRPINPTRHLPGLFKALCSRLNKGRNYNVELSPRLGNTETVFNGFESPPPLYQEQSTCLEIENDAFLEGDMTTMYTECLSLNGSFGVGGTSKRRTLSIAAETKDNKDGGSEDEDSDWDSWSEEEEEGDSTLADTFTDFITKMKTTMNSDSKDVMNKEIEKLKDTDSETIKKLLASN